MRWLAIALVACASCKPDHPPHEPHMMVRVTETCAAQHDAPVLLTWTITPSQGPVLTRERSYPGCSELTFSYPEDFPSTPTLVGGTLTWSLELGGQPLADGSASFGDGGSSAWPLHVGKTTTHAVPAPWDHVAVNTDGGTAAPR